MTTRLAVIIDVPRRYARLGTFGSGKALPSRGGMVCCASRQAAVAWAKKAGLKIACTGYWRTDENTLLYCYEPDQ